MKPKKDCKCCKGTGTTPIVYQVMGGSHNCYCKEKSK